MRVLYALLCENAVVRNDDQLDAQGIFRRLYAPGFPAEHEMVLALAVEWDAGETGRQQLRVDMLDASDSPVLTVAGHTEVTPPIAGEAPPLTLLVQRMQRVVFPAAGTYQFVLETGGERTPLVPLHLGQYEEEE